MAENPGLVEMSSSNIDKNKSLPVYQQFSENIASDILIWKYREIQRENILKYLKINEIGCMDPILNELNKQPLFDTYTQGIKLGSVILTGLGCGDAFNFTFYEIELLWINGLGIIMCILLCFFHSNRVRIGVNYFVLVLFDNVD